MTISTEGVAYSPSEFQTLFLRYSASNKFDLLWHMHLCIDFLPYNTQSVGVELKRGSLIVNIDEYSEKVIEYILLTQYSQHSIDHIWPILEIIR